MAVAVVTDSTAYLPADLIERHGIHVVPLYVVFGGDRTVRGGHITDYPAFFDELRAAESLPAPLAPDPPRGGASIPPPAAVRGRLLDSLRAVAGRRELFYPYAHPGGVKR